MTLGPLAGALGPLGLARGHRVTSYRELVLADGAVGYWRLGEASGDLVDSGSGGYDATATGSVTRAVTGALVGDADGAFETAGGYAEATGLEVALLGSAASIECWLRAGAIDGVALAYPIGIGGPGGIVLAVRAGGVYTDADNASQSLMLYKPGSGFASSVASTMRESVDRDAWRHVVWTYDAAASPRTAIYKDGVALAMLNDQAAGALDAQSTIRIGQRTDGFGAWRGALDELALYPTALPAGTVLAHYLAGIGG